ncbi:hypothetical protein VS_II0154 [Vibrio atlanticus]|uniref:Uncharacterized protein n=1 Tax=Vibrio atlanticus (strain LGP32) TaxID=575788 RepID=B7VQC4_VIBA3|nr:hypothetical protein VS_II0154 [Vibrio atlanticus]
MTSHERHIQAPTSQTNKRNVQQFMLKEELSHWHLVFQDRRQDHDIRPTEVIRHHQVPLLSRDVFPALNLPLDIVIHIQHPKVKRSPTPKCEVR